VDRVELDFQLHATQTLVHAVLDIRPNPAGTPGASLRLDGDELALVALALDGAALPETAYSVTKLGLVIHQPPAEPFRLAITTTVNPSANSKLMGLYRSSGTYCTQCEADGFRRITYYPDRPDVMAIFRVRLEAEVAEAPVLLSNGNCVESGPVPGTGRHFAVWEDPFPKPCYLFALVGGDLGAIHDSFTTQSGRNVALGIYVEKGKEGLAGYAMDALKRSMRWDEMAWGREYDLAVFNIVAVSDFNMGAMENKGLNIFNDKYILASPETATDGDYALIEAIIAHEYFHNWTGNRITCRDWFQLCLKEGLTVFRDQEFTGDMRSRPVKRIRDVLELRARQFPEDGGPLAHPVRPAAYREINNFYTATVYEKGAEVIRMLQTQIGEAAFRAGMDLYFQRHDGEATTVDAFVQCFAEASKRDLGAFFRWYEQAGTPTLTVTRHHDAANQRLTLRFHQATPPTPGEPHKQPQVIPVALGLVTPNEAAQPTRLFVLDREEAELVLEGVPPTAVPSLLRGFSAPVKLVADLGDADLLTLAAHDSDTFNRWQSLHTLAMRLLVRASQGAAPDSVMQQGLAEAVGRVVADATLEPAYAALALGLPSETEVAQELGSGVDPDQVHAARAALRAGIARHVAHLARQRLAALDTSGPYSPDAEAAGRRALKSALLALIVAADPGAGEVLADEVYRGADNMTERMAALSLLAHFGTTRRESALADFEARHGGNALVMDKWFALQASIQEPGTLERLGRLLRHPAFTMGNPNRVRSLFGAFAGNPTEFNRADGAGYAFLADAILQLDRRNPQVASRLATGFRSWRMLETGRQELARRTLERLADTDPLSPDVRDIVERTLS
jgi:aminopeptidase N